MALYPELPGGSDDATVHPITADEVWDFCSHGFVAD